MHTDPIADMLTRIRNAQAVKKPEIVLPYSKLKFNILNLMSEKGWIGKVEKILPSKVKQGSKTKKEDISKFIMLKAELKYDGREPVITSIKRISKPGRRVYVGKDSIPTVLNNLGIAIISTPKGILTSKDAKKNNLGGEVLCEIY